MTTIWTGNDPDGTTAQDIAGDLERRAAVRANVKRHLIECGQTGATTADLTERFGGHAIVRLNELRHVDPIYDYRKEREGVGYRYWLYKPGADRGRGVVVPEPSGDEPQPGMLF